VSGGRLVWTPHRLQAPSELRTARGGSLVPSPHFRAWTILQQAGFPRCSNPLVEALQLEGSHPPAFPFLHCATGTRHTVPADGEEKRERGAIFIGLDGWQGLQGHVILETSQENRARMVPAGAPLPGAGQKKRMPRRDGNRSWSRPGRAVGCPRQRHPSCLREAMPSSSHPAPGKRPPLRLRQPDRRAEFCSLARRASGLRAIHSMKATTFRPLLKLMRSRGSGIDAASAGEVQTALEADFAS
jgi:hypothetical protein